MKSDNQKYCAECREIIPRIAEICPRCDAPQSVHIYSQITPAQGQNLTRKNHKDKLVAALLALFLGGFGIHHFYLGNIARGIFYLIFFWTFIPAIIAFFEAIFFLIQGEDTFDNKYNR